MKSGILLFGMLFILSPLFSQSVQIERLKPDQVVAQGFTLPGTTVVKITGSGAVFTDEWRLLLYYGWIIDAQSRKVVWHLFDFMKETKSKDADGVFDFTSEVELPAGTYELYYAAMHDNENYDGWNGPWTIENFGDVMDKVFSSRDREKFRTSLIDELFIKVSGSGVKAVDYRNLVDKKASEAVVSFNRVGDNQNLKQGFTLSGDAKLRIYAIGEGRKRELYDYVWIYDAVTRDRVFKMDYLNTAYAGGAKKNLITDEVVSLKKGSYIVSYVTDDSHSYDQWNSLPPDDLQFWGVTIWPATEADRKKVVPFVAPKGIESIVNLTGVRNNQVVSAGISLTKEMDVRIFCLGEQGNDETMVDYGWIADAKTKEKVWRMKTYRSEPAGGDYKNRAVSEVITLPPGDYIVYYTSDDSHAYGSWNANKPHDEELWGITLWPTKEEDIKYVTSFDAKGFKNKNVILEVIMVGDYESIREDFSLTADTKTRILAIGEGDSGEMYDYGYIKDLATNMIVWEMDYRNSTHAGGASKNREFNESIILKKGDYRLYYRTDGSHSYKNWNSSPPTNQEMYGIVLLKENQVN